MLMETRTAAKSRAERLLFKTCFRKSIKRPMMAVLVALIAEAVRCCSHSLAVQTTCAEGHGSLYLHVLRVTVTLLTKGAMAPVLLLAAVLLHLLLLYCW